VDQINLNAEETVVRPGTGGRDIGKHLCVASMMAGRLKERLHLGEARFNRRTHHVRHKTEDYGPIYLRIY
jgi:hypothetical protein